MFAPRDVNRQLEIANWVVAAINATNMARLAVKNKQLPIQSLQDVLEGIVNGAVKEIMKIDRNTISPSVN